jgi:A/G-specific adenine glycosylase
MILARGPAGEILLERRPPVGIWGGLWSLPETDPRTDPAHWCQMRLGQRPLLVEMHAPRRHTFSHFTLAIRLAEVRTLVPQAIADNDRERWCLPAERERLGIPAPVKAILDDL